MIPNSILRLINEYIIDKEYLEMDKDKYFQMCVDDATRYIAKQFLNVFEGLNIQLSTPLHIRRYSN